ncbi:MAG: hypothetical protein COV66_09155 [Nitrospinae bacterium CG11_big_fil_rev_8_21_14_0_20_45_15]|nr:MAG: hypothetical protein COV66_09155 [Nitrospinae bacterium CG11_big_fil_rev_8_21_14_0_20_45_15]
MTAEKKNKYDFLNHLLSEGDAMVCIDARRDDVDVPKLHKNNPSLNLIFNLNFRRTLEVLPEGIYATLAFNGKPHQCVIPFEAIWAIYDPSMKQGQVWEEDFPKDIDPLEFSATGGQVQSPDPKKPSQVKKNPVKKTLPGSDRPKRDRSHLRVIK